MLSVAPIQTVAFDIGLEGYVSAKVANPNLHAEASTCQLCKKCRGHW